MKKIRMILLLVCMFLFSSKANAKEAQFMGISTPVSLPEDILPGDESEQEFSVANQSEQTIRVRINSIRNQKDSELYGALKVRYGNGDYVLLSDFSTEWMELGKNESQKFDLKFLLPDETTNEYQGKTLCAEVVFEAASPQGTAGQRQILSVRTGDDEKIYVYLTAVVMGLVLAALLLIIRRMTHEEGR